MTESEKKNEKQASLSIDPLLGLQKSSLFTAKIFLSFPPLLSPQEKRVRKKGIAESRAKLPRSVRRKNPLVIGGVESVFEHFSSSSSG